MASYRKMTEEDFKKYAAYVGSDDEAYISDDVSLHKDGVTPVVIADEEGICLHSEVDTYCYSEVGGDLEANLKVLKYIVKHDGEISVNDLIKVGFF